MKTMHKIIHLAETRGHFDYGWLDTRHTFSFSSYYNPDRIQFGKLRVLNDDIVMPGEGFSIHPHNNMEIVSIPITGIMAHKDSENNEYLIQPGEVQIMSAGSGITHSEYNHSAKEKLNFLQIWILPKKINIRPRYDQKLFPDDQIRNRLKAVISPNDTEALWINQDAVLSIGIFDKISVLNYNVIFPNNGIYLFVIDGSFQVEKTKLNRRDGMGIVRTEAINIETSENSRLLIIEVPL